MGSSRVRDQTRISCIGRWILYHWATRETLYFIFWGIVFLDIEFFVSNIFLSTLYMSSYFLLDSIVSNQDISFSFYWEFLLCDESLLSFCFWESIFGFIFWLLDYNLSRCDSLSIYPTWISLSFLDVQIIVYLQIWDILSHHLFKYSFSPFQSHLSFWDSYHEYVDMLAGFPQVSELLFNFHYSFS